MRPWVHVHERVERNLMAVLAGGRDQRAANIAQTPHAVGRVGELLLLAAIGSRPDRWAALLGRRPPGDVAVVGSGSEHTVVLRGRHVEKIHRRSVFMSAEEQVALARETARLHAVQSSYLGDLAVGQTTAVAEHPLNRDLLAVVSCQPWVAYERIGVFRAHGPSIDHAGLESNLERLAWLAAALHHVAVIGLRMHAETGLLLDCTGMDNIVVAAGSERLVCLDGVPIATRSEVDTTRILGQLDALRRATGR